ncbi:flagellin [Fodinicurvata sediminis]|uniref:flagellin n=1 Tax=Fodinicurvata sediminis TaxID=1121832 RepID=UPI0003B52EDF|nr:flagellin [Fodinicurvata sediminis]
MANSINTNAGAMVALQNLNKVSSEMETIQNRISTGLRVSRAQDDGAVFAVAQGLRSDVGSLTSVNEQLGGAKGLVDTTITSLTNVSDTMGEMKNILVKLADENVNGDTRTQYEEQYKSLAANVEGFIEDSRYNGKSLINDGSAAVHGSVSVIRNEQGENYTVDSYSAAASIFNLISSGALGTNAASAAALLTGSFATAEQRVGTQLNNYANDAKFIDNQVSFNRDKADAIERGLGALVDADLAKESANLQALQVKQQLSTQSLGIANQSSQVLLSLFGG